MREMNLLKIAFEKFRGQCYWYKSISCYCNWIIDRKCCYSNCPIIKSIKKEIRGKKGGDKNV